MNAREIRKLKLSVLSEKIRSNDTSLGRVLNCYSLFHEHGMTLFLALDDD